jgi:hypothetical protein
VGNIEISGLPFSASSSSRFAGTIADMRSWGTAFTTPITATVQDTANFLILTKQATNASFSGVGAGDLGSGSGNNSIQIAGFYTV